MNRPRSVHGAISLGQIASQRRDQREQSLLRDERRALLSLSVTVLLLLPRKEVKTGKVEGRDYGDGHERLRRGCADAARQPAPVTTTGNRRNKRAWKLFANGNAKTVFSCTFDARIETLWKNKETYEGDPAGTFSFFSRQTFLLAIHSPWKPVRLLYERFINVFSNLRLVKARTKWSSTRQEALSPLTPDSVLSSNR